MSDSSLCYGDSGSAYCCWKYVWLLEYNWHGGRLEWRQSSAEIKRISLNGFCFYVQQFSNEYQKLLRWTSSRSIIAKRKKKTSATIQACWPQAYYQMSFSCKRKHTVSCFLVQLYFFTKEHVKLFSVSNFALLSDGVFLCYWKVFSWKIKINCDSSETNYRYSLKQNSTWTIFTKFSYSF